MDSEMATTSSVSVLPDRHSHESLWVIAALGIYPVLALIISLQQGEAAWQLRLGDSDNYLRMAQIRDWLGGQSWWDVSQHRVNPPGGLDTHWSRLADLPYALPMMLLGLLVSPDLAERVVVTAMPPLLLLLTLLATARLADLFGGWRAAVCACLLIAVSPEILAQYVPGRIDHHGLQILLLIFAIMLIVRRDSRSSGLAAAFVCAVSLAIGLETLPYLAAIAAWVAGRWIARDGEARSTTLAFALGLALFVPLVAAATIPASHWLAERSDAIGRGHVLAASLGGGIFAIAILVIRGETIAARLAQGGLAAIAALIALATFPEIVRAPYSNVDPILQRLWLDNLGETRSFLDYWRDSPTAAAARFFFPALSALAALTLVVRTRGKDRDRYALIGLLALMALPLALWQGRAGAAATALLIPAAAAALAMLWARWNAGGSVLPFALAALLLNPILPPAIVQAFHVLVKRDQAGGSFAANGASSRRCDGAAQFRDLAQLDRGLVLNPIDQSATILVRTNHSVITAGNHRNASANQRAYRILAARADAAQPLVRELEVKYIVFCTSAPEVGNIARYAPMGLLASLRSGMVPPWLAPVPSAENQGLRVFAVNP